jgi:branched-chain amino acid transport system substrate-binding protein
MPLITKMPFTTQDAGAGPAHLSDQEISVVTTMRLSKRAAALAGTVALLLTAAACGNGSTSTSGSGTGGSSAASAPGVTAKSVTVGLLTSLTGPVAAGFTTVATGFQARIALQNAHGGVNGRHINVVLGDDQGSTSGALTGAQTLVQQKQAFAIGMISVVGFAAQPYLTREGVPVTGTPLDGPEWSPPNNNMFPTTGSPDANFPAPATWGAFFKRQGATNVAVVGNNSPSAVAAAKNVGASAKAAGLKSTYLNYTIPFTQEGGFGSIVQQMKQENVNGIYIAMEPTATFSLLETMKQAGMNVKAYLMDLAPPAAIFQNPQAAAAAQDTWVPSYWTPIGLHTPATEAFQAALRTYAHQTAAPDQNEYDGWAAASAIIKGLQVAGKNPTRASFIAGLRAVTNFTADGLLVSPENMKTSFGTSAEGPGPGPGDCMYYSQYKGTGYVTDPQPVCGGIVPNSNAG